MDCHPTLSSMKPNTPPEKVEGREEKVMFRHSHIFRRVCSVAAFQRRSAPHMQTTSLYSSQCSKRCTYAAQLERNDDQDGLKAHWTARPLLSLATRNLAPTDQIFLIASSPSLNALQPEDCNLGALHEPSVREKTLPEMNRKGLPRFSTMRGFSSPPPCQIPFECVCGVCAGNPWRCLRGNRW